MSALTDIAVLEHLAYSVFLPPKLPQVEQELSFQLSVELTIVRSIGQAIQEYSSQSEPNPQWNRIELMILRLAKYLEASPEILEAQLYEGIKAMRPGDLFPLYIRAQNAAVIIRKQSDHTDFEVFEAQAQTEDVMSVPGKFVHHFPGPAVGVPGSVAGDDDFIKELANILARMNRESFAHAFPRVKRDGKDYRESHDPVNPNYFIQYLLGFLRGMGSTINPPRVVKRLADDVLWMGTGNPWRRSPIWLIVRVALQTSLDSTTTYKCFIIYYHADILSRCFKCNGFSSDLLYAMRIKMARRLYKLQNSAPQFLFNFAKDAAEGTQALLRERWEAIQFAQAQSHSQNFSSSDFESAIGLTLPASGNYLQQVFEGRSRRSNPVGFTPSHSPRLEHINEFSQYSNGSLSRAFASDPHLALFDFEASVFENLSHWTTQHRSCIGSCTAIFSCFQQYLTAAKSYYVVDVADQSIMVLTLLRLWMAIDDLATSECPLLLEFSPELPDDILDPLLLRTFQHIHQARIIRQYIRGRRARASSGNLSIFSDYATDSSFAVQYFRMSPLHQRLKLDIEKDAQEQRDRKIQELEELNMRSHLLSREMQDMVHQYYEIPDQTGRANETSRVNYANQTTSGQTRPRSQHSMFCELCLKEKQRRAIQIQPHEWPLPPSQLEAEVVVFELQRPESFTIWRDVTYAILLDLNSSIRREKFNQRATIEGYHALTTWLSNPVGIQPRIIMGSASGTFDQLRHNIKINIPAKKEQVCINNPLHFKLYDKVNGTWASEPFPDVTLAKYGTLKLPENSPYQHLEYALEGTTHTSNRVLADQHDCHNDLGLQEHIAFGTLRSGGRLQWMNIVRGLEEGLLTLNLDEVRLLHNQAAWQIGPLSHNGSHQWHEDLGQSEFGSLLVSQCMRVLNRVKASRRQVNSVLIIVTLVVRLLASLPSEEVTQAACDFLREARAATYQWLAELEVQLQALPHEDIIDYQRQFCEVAALCRATYDVEPCYMERLVSTSSDYTVLIESFIGLCHNRSPDLQNAPTNLQILLGRDRRFAHKMAPFLLAAINHEESGILSGPLHKVWPDYQQGSIGWRVLQAPNNRWVTAPVAGNNENQIRQMHLNVLTGQLLLDGQPLGGLPEQYTEHTTYVRLFGQKILKVVPAKSLGMEFATRTRIHGYQVSFSLVRGMNQLIIQAEKDDRLYELIPHEIMAQDFPVLLSEDYYHWADVENRIIEFRPISSPWSADECRWVLRVESHHAATLRRTVDGSFLFNVHCALFQSLCRTLSPLESDRYIHITRLAEGLVEVELPRMRLSFFINENTQVESRNFKGQVIDENQSAGTLFGLKNQLVLRTKGSIAQSFPQSRCVLIPDGQIGFMKSGHHVSVSIQFDSQRSIDVHRYNINEGLGYLEANGGLTSRLFKIYLHALTSHCLPDPLMKRTGTEEALHELSQASTSSFAQIDLKQAELLIAIGRLTPIREYYPNHLQCMQTTRWAELPSISQHFAWSYATKNVLSRADTLQLFHPLDFNLQERIAVLQSPNTLTKRAAQRTGIYYPSDTPSNILRILDPPKVLDMTCMGRDSLVGDWEEAGQAAMWASGLVIQNWGRPVFKSYGLLSLLQSCGTLDDTKEHDTLSYHSSWFKFNIKTSWINLYDLLRRATISSNKYMLSACLAGIAFGRRIPTELIPVFVAFATNPEFQSLDPPSRGSFQFGDGYEPTRGRLEELVSDAASPIESTPAQDLIQNENESSCDFRLRKECYYSTHLSRYQSQLVDDLLGQWSHVQEIASGEIHSSSLDRSRWINIESCFKSVGQYFRSCSSNAEMNDHLRKLETVLASRPPSLGTTFIHVNQGAVQAPVASRVYIDPWSAINTTSLMRSRPAPELANLPLLCDLSVSSRTGQETDTSRLAGLLSEFRQDQNPLNCRYGTDLDESRRELARRQRVAFPRQLPQATIAVLTQKLAHCENYLAHSFNQLTSALWPQTDIEYIVFLAGVWPRVTSRTIIQQLALQNRLHLNPEWRNEIIGYAQGFLNYQKSQRLILLAESGDTEEFYKNLDFASEENKIGIDEPDWLLVQIDGNFDVRSLQRQVARGMMSPSSGSNSVLQLNMGEGKSSVVVPIIASSLADSSRLVRVVVLKPLWRQMFELLINRLSGLANRRIYYLPFGRHIHVDENSLQKLRNLYEECMREGGVLLAQPEHILSFKLMGIDRLMASTTLSNIAVSTTLIAMQAWLKAHSRDVLDESDEILHVRYRLVYTIGEQRPLDDHTNRWTTTQQILRLAATHMERIYKEHSDVILYQPNDRGRFPTLHIMVNCQAEVEKNLIAAIATDVIGGHLLNLNCDLMPPLVQQLLLDFFVSHELPHSQYEFLRSHCSPTIWKSLLLVRGLLASGILIHVLKYKHYRVDYGLDLKRSLLAVPYRAKDIPSMAAEFADPDIAVALTCLSYYYHGLPDQHLKLCFKLLLRSDDPSVEYEHWVKQNDAIPGDLKQLNTVNPNDRQQFTERLIPAFSHNPTTIDFFLSSAVFPQEAKEFPERLGTSGWDLAERKSHATTGFSGTNDNRYLLPTSITQVDPARQCSTNALVLTYLLQPENNFYVCMRTENGENISTQQFLHLLVSQNPEVRVLLDVGAQILELQNEELVRCWLGLRPDIEAGVYFNNRDELVLLPQNGIPVPLSTSSFAQRLDKCIVYLDNGHTRGTDLKLPRETRAMVTLGAKVTKDGLLQGCMRMRKLGHGQSVMFAAPPELDSQIRKAAPIPIDAEGPLSVLDILRWTMLKTCHDLQKHVSDWARQGIEFDSRLEADQQYEQSLDISMLQKGWIMPESRSLEEMYGVTSPEDLHNRPNFTQRAFNMPALKERLEYLGVEKIEDSGMDEEQEREVDHEAERERQTQPPLKRTPAEHSIHPDVQRFVDTGVPHMGQSGIVPLYRPLSNSNHQLSSACSHLLFASVDFLQAIDDLPIDQVSDFMRPVNWVLSGPGRVRVILSPFEVNELLPLIRGSSIVRLHVYAPRASLSILSFSDLRFYTIPALPTNHISSRVLSVAQLQLDLFAGQLYFSSYQDYTSLCAILGLKIPEANQDNLLIEAESDGFINPENRAKLIHRHPLYASCVLTSTPIPALKDLFVRRRKGMKYLLTHMGQILRGRTLNVNDF